MIAGFDRSYGQSAPSSSSSTLTAEEAHLANASVIVDANNQFALDFYSSLTNGDWPGNETKDSNIFFSPWSILTAFSMAYEGAEGRTAKEMQSVFYLPEEDSMRRSSFALANDKLANNDTSSLNFTLHSANALWVQDGYPILPEYIDTAEKYYDSEVDNVDFASEEAVNVINEWVKSKTNDTIDQMLNPGWTDEYTRMVITNAVYFKGMWVEPFDESDTSDEDFTTADGRVVKVPMMKLENTNSFNYTETNELQILELPYQGGNLSMLILLPKQNSTGGLESVEESLTIENLRQWRGNMSMELIEAVHLPKFSLETSYDLIEDMAQMGMPSAFDSSAADFSGITGGNDLYIKRALHKAFVDVNEEGTEASASTALSFATSSPGPTTYRFVADHQFIFMIQDNETGNILFMGKIVEPQLE